MSSAESFRDLVLRIRAGDSAAAEELVKTYEPEIRRAVRVRLTDARMRRVLDSVDICQSVLANFFVRVAAGQFDLESPDQLLKLLVTMARNRITDWSRRHQALCRDGRRDVSVDDANDSSSQLPGNEPSPSRVVAGRELLDQVRRRLAQDELQLMDWRSQGWSWTEIADELKTQPNAVRMRLVRALDRAAAELDVGGAVDV